MSVQIVRYTVKAESVADVEAGIKATMAAVQREKPKGVRYAMCKLPDGVTFVGVLELEDGVENPLPGIDAARALQQSLKNWVVGGRPMPERVEVIGTYKLFD